MSMEGVIQYRLLGDHPAASGRYLTIGFPGETTTKDKIVEQVIQEHRINTSRYKLEVRKLVSPRDTLCGKNAKRSPPPPGGAQGTYSGSNTTNNNSNSNAVGNGDDTSGVSAGASARDAFVPIVLHGNEELHTYDRLTITVSQRQLADDDATRKEQEQLERRRRVREMEEELLLATSPSAGLPQLSNRAGDAHLTSSVTPPPLTSASPSAPPRPDTSRLPRRAGVTGTTPVPTVDAIRLQRAAALASQIFPIMNGQHSDLTSINDPANTHQCVLCHLPAFEEMLTNCCRFCVCVSCYVSAAEMDMEEGRCPVCGAKNVMLQEGSSEALVNDDNALGHSGDGDDKSGGGHKRERGGSYDPRTSSGVAGWKREDVATDSKDVLQRKLGLGERRGDIQSHETVCDRGVSAAAGALSPGKVESPSSLSGASSSAVPGEVLQIEKRLRQDLEKALSSLDGPDTLSAAAKAKRVVSAELASLCEE